MAMLTSILLLLAVGMTYVVTRWLYNSLRYHRLAKEWSCQPAPKIPAPFLGIGRFLTTIADSDMGILRLLDEGFRQYGMTYEHMVLGESQFATIEPENIKALLATKFPDFSIGLRHNAFYPLLGDGIFNADGELWSHSRALLRPQFSREQVADIALLREHANHLIAALPKDKTAFDIQELFYRLTLDSATEFLFGESTNSLSPNFNPASGPLAACGGERGFADSFTLCLDYIICRARLQSLYWLINPPRFHRAVKTVNDVVDYYVDRVLDAKSNPKDQSSNENKRYVFLEALAEETRDRKMLRDQMLNILLAGRDTTASLLTSSFYYLARHPEVWSRLRQEIIEAFPIEEKDSITLERLREVKYIRYFLNEVMRLLPPVPVNARIAVKDTMLPTGGGPDRKSPILVKKGMTVAWPVWHMHRRTDIWGTDAHEFRPDRWEDDAKKGWGYLPFNGGPRICLGQQYALAEASYMLVRLLQQFDILENAQPEMILPRPKTNLTLSHKEGVQVRLWSSSFSQSLRE
ncbi:hypothetical protein Egran_04001 [Elaphomyces granulatus]|uniref:Cytochrome P450 alkane hydroxylase n=1 Tax=Elaphomyces granulatus TaxID=519963 RepID=A0A232LVU1_9EURO|nr:hypothetical protein Egran_04001 [Elaphomyces granulatus]